MARHRKLYAEIDNNIQELRCYRNMSQQELANAANISISTVRRIEKEGGGQAKTLSNISKALNFPLEKLLKFNT